MDSITGEIESGTLGEKIVIETRRRDGSLSVVEYYDNCPTMTEQHTAHLSDLNYLISKYKPDELAAYISARNQYRQEIVGHDFANEPDLQDARNVVYKLKKSFEELPEEITSQFKNHVEFLKFIDNPANQAKMIKLGLLTPPQIKKLSTDTQNDDLNDKTSPQSSKTKIPSKKQEPE